MYLNHYKLKAKPFEISCDPRFLWLGEHHREALSMMRYGIMSNSGFLLLTGEVGTGKTVLINRLTTLLPEDTIVAHLADPDLTCMDFFRLMADEFQLPLPFSSKGEFIIQLRRFLYSKATEKKPILLIIDEAQRLGHQLMEQIRVLSNIEFHDRKLITIFFVGQQEINQKLMRQENRALAQRIRLRYHIEPLTLFETGNYIRHRLKVAGRSRTIFKTSAVEKIFNYSSGIPRIINIMCDRALLTGYIREVQKLDADIIAECAEELRIPVPWGTPIAAMKSAKAPSGRIGIRSTVAKNSSTNFASAQVQVFNIPAEEKRLFRPSRKKLLYPGTAALVLIALAFSLINIYNRSKPYRDELTSLQSATLPPPGSVDSRHTRPKEPAPRLQTKAPPTSPSNQAEAVPLPSVQSGKRPAPAKATLKSNSKPVSAVKKKASLEKGPVKGLYRMVPVKFDPANRIANQSQTAVDKVATYLLNHPERVIYIYGQSGESDLPKHRRIALHQQLATLKTYLINQGAYASQIKVLAKTVPAANRTTGKRLAYQAMIEFTQNHVFSDYNPDK